jgi:hypothetical protein
MCHGTPTAALVMSATGVAHRARSGHDGDAVRAFEPGLGGDAGVCNRGVPDEVIAL